MHQRLWKLRSVGVALAGFCAAAVTSALEAAEPADPLPLAQAHSHNDYEHARPLHDALDRGFCSVEADIYLVDGALLVAHDRPKVRPERTLQALYLDPLRALVRAHGGRVHRNGPSGFTLLIDLKTPAEPTYLRLREVLVPYRDLLTRYETNRVLTNAVTVILSGNRPWELLASEPVRWASLDGRPPDLDREPPLGLVPLVSDSWRNHFAWNGQGTMPRDQRQKLDELVRRTHGQGRKLRFWGAADVPEMWRVQREAGVDLINTDRLPELADFLGRR